MRAIKHKHCNEIFFLGGNVKKVSFKHISEKNTTLEKNSDKCVNSRKTLLYHECWDVVTDFVTMVIFPKLNSFQKIRLQNSNKQNKGNFVKIHIVTKDCSYLTYHTCT